MPCGQRRRLPAFTEQALERHPVNVRVDSRTTTARWCCRAALPLLPFGTERRIEFPASLLDCQAARLVPLARSRSRAGRRFGGGARHRLNSLEPAVGRFPFRSPRTRNRTQQGWVFGWFPCLAQWNGCCQGLLRPSPRTTDPGAALQYGPSRRIPLPQPRV